MIKKYTIRTELIDSMNMKQYQDAERPKKRPKKWSRKEKNDKNRQK